MSRRVVSCRVVCRITNQLHRVLPEKLTGSQLLKKFSSCMEPEGSFPNSQVPATYPCHEPDQFSPCYPYHFLNIHFNIFLHSTRCFTKLYLSLMFPHQNPLCTSSLTHTCYVPRRLILIDLITRLI
jgi:hypothetical protein